MDHLAMVGPRRPSFGGHATSFGPAVRAGRGSTRRLRETGDTRLASVDPRHKRLNTTTPFLTTRLVRDAVRVRELVDADRPETIDRPDRDSVLVQPIVGHAGRVAVSAHNRG